jgi:O6-methylguanine-DNA--protein-cysteine methyltransferase
MAEKSNNSLTANRHLHDVNQVVDRLISADHKLLLRRVDEGSIAEDQAMQRQNPQREERAKQREDRRAQAAFRRLERQMNAITDPELLHRARVDQKGTAFQGTMFVAPMST